MNARMRRILVGLMTAIALAVAQIAPLGVSPAQATVNSSANKTIVLGNGSQTQFSFSFVGVATAYIAVIYTDASGNQTVLAQGSGATQYQVVLNAPVQGAIWGLGGTVTYNPSGTPIANGTTLTIYRTLPLTQAITLQNQSSIAALGKGAETGLDTGVMQTQQINEQIGRAIVANITNSAPPLPLPAAAQLANKGACFDSTGNNMIGCTLPSSGVISSAMQPVVNAATLALGRTAFGLGSAAVENVGSYGLVDDGAGTLRQNFVTAADATNQAPASSFHLTQRFCTGPITYTLARANTLWNGYGFWVYAISGLCTVTPNAADNFQGVASGASIAIPQGTACFITTNAAASGLWQANCNNAQANLSASVGASALTISLNATTLPFRDPTLANGDALWVLPAGNLSITVPSTATLGAASSNVPFRVWIFAAYNSGTPVLGVAVCSTTTAILPCKAWETIRKSGTAITTGSTSAGVLYTTSAVTNDAVRIIGYAEYASGLATAGTWASAPTTVQLCLAPFTCPRPGEIIQEAYSTTAATTSCTSTSFTVATALTNSITPTSTPNLIRIQAVPSGAAGGSAALAFQISRGAGPTLIGNLASFSTGIAGTVPLLAVDAPASVSATTYTVYCKNTNATGTFNGGSTTSSMTLEEIMGALPEPANDNGTFGQRFVA